MRRVLKFGGTSLATPELVREGAEHVARLVEYGEQIAVVVSAPGNTTSELLEAIYSAGGKQVEFTDACAIAALGEERSVYLMTAALRSFDISALALLPRDTETWPIIADLEDHSPLSTVKVNEERPFRLSTQQTVNRFRRFVLPSLRVGSVPVIAGFFAVDSSERMVAMGRGASDITAFIVATQISADEVVIVTDVKGVLSADPRLAKNPRLLEELSLADLELISGAGMRVIHPRALKFKSDNLRVRLVDYRELDHLEESGTSVLGRSETTLYRNPDELSMLTVVGKLGEVSDLQAVVHSWLKENSLPLSAASASRRFSCFYLPSEVAEQAYRELHAVLSERFPELTSINLRGGVGELCLSSAKFIDQPGVITEVASVLSNAKINIIEVITGLTDISVFVPHEEMDRAESLLSRVLEHFAE
ncbi:ACT domain-containing protein [bacterium]|nr:ACT domain-containing protein [bacterium]